MNRVSDKKAARVKSGTVKLGHNSTFQRKPAKKVFRKVSKSKAMKQADQAFSKWIRLRDSNAEGYVSCVTCGKLKFWTEVDAGHYVSRAKQSTRYDERNANAQCKRCNQFEGGHFVEHGFAIDKKHGEGTFRKLLEKGLMRCSRTTSDFLFIAQTYKMRVKWVEENEPSKFRAAA